MVSCFLTHSVHSLSNNELHNNAQQRKVKKDIRTLIVQKKECHKQIFTELIHVSAPTSTISVLSKQRII